jgi:hypothetical protein
MLPADGLLSGDLKCGGNVEKLQSWDVLKVHTKGSIHLFYTPGLDYTLQFICLPSSPVLSVYTYIQPVSLTPKITTSTLPNS